MIGARFRTVIRPFAVPAVAAACLLGFSSYGARAADAVSGTWGPVQADGKAKCQGLAVTLFHEGRYFRVLPNVGSTGGINQYVLSKSTYRISGDEIVVEPALSFTHPLPRQRYLLNRSGEKAIVLQGKQQVTFKPCPPMDPAALDLIVK